MFCQRCGNKLEEGAAFCPKCGTQTGNVNVAATEEKAVFIQQGQPEKRKKPRYLKYTCIVIGLLFITGIVLSLFGGNDNTESTSSTLNGDEEQKNKYISLVQNGYLGEYTDATVQEILAVMFDLEGCALKWTNNEMHGEEFVGFHVYTDESRLDSDPDIGILFKICSEDTFKISDYYGGGGVDFELTEIADLFNNWYMVWYIENKIGQDVPEDRMMAEIQSLIRNQLDHISGTAVLYGASRDYQGDRKNLCEIIDGGESLSMSVTELMNFYGNDMLDIYTTEEPADEAENMNEAFNLERVNDKYYINGTDEYYTICFYIENDTILFSVYWNDEYDVIRQAEAAIVDENTLHFEGGWDNWDIDFTWDGEGSFTVTGEGSEIADMIGTQFFDTSVYAP